MKRFTLTLEEDEFGDIILPIPDEVIDELGWGIGDELDFSVDGDNSFILKKLES